METKTEMDQGEQHKDEEQKALERDIADDKEAAQRMEQNITQQTREEKQPQPRMSSKGTRHSQRPFVLQGRSITRQPERTYSNRMYMDEQQRYSSKTWNG